MVDTFENRFYSAHAIRQCEQQAMAHEGISEEELMNRAGSAAFSVLKLLYPDVHSIAVFCGAGNNAGDGYVLAKLAAEEGLTVVIYFYKAIEQLPPVVAQAALSAIEAGVICHPLCQSLEPDVDLVVDALLGTGIQSLVQDPIKAAIHLINTSELPVFSLDIPSGLHPDTGQVMGACVRASVTTTFIGYKLGLFTLDGPDYCGKIVREGLQLDPYLAAIPPDVHRLNTTLLQGLLPARNKNSSKSTYGHVLVIGGSLGMPGAVVLAAQAALRAGAGAVSIGTCLAYQSATVALLPEAMVHGLEIESDLDPLLANANVVVIGPGLTPDAWGKSLLLKVIGSKLPCVIDAGALRLLAEETLQEDHWVLTPHPGEAAALLANSVKDIQSNRFEATERMQQQYGGCVMLKGAGSIIATDEGEISICTAGNPGMATSGMGDVLSGVIGGLIAQGMPLADALKMGVFVHARAGDKAIAGLGERGLLASDLMPHLRQQINELG